MPSQTALQALQQAAQSWRQRAAIQNPSEVEAQRLLEWIEGRPDLLPPVAFETLNRSERVIAGRPLLLPGDPLPWFVKPPLYNLPGVWLPADPSSHLSRTSPVALLWDESPARCRETCRAAAFLRAAATGSAPELAHILKGTGLPAAAALVEHHADEDGLYGPGAGRMPTRFPSPRRLLLEAFLGPDHERDRLLLEVIAAGGEDWDSGPDALPVPRGHARLPGESEPSIDWISHA